MNHYFIGKLLNPEDSRQLQGKQKFISKNIPSTGKVFNFNTKFAYLGYMDQATILQLKDKLSNIFEAVSARFSPIEATYLRYDITGLKTTKKSVALIYQSPTITDIIVPYIRDYTSLLADPSTDFIPHISILRFDARDIANVKKSNASGENILGKTNLPVPPILTIDSIDILKGTPKIKRQGPPSRYDDMDIEVIDKYMLRGAKPPNQ